MIFNLVSADVSSMLDEQPPRFYIHKDYGSRNNETEELWPKYKIGCDIIRLMEDRLTDS